MVDTNFTRWNVDRCSQCSELFEPTDAREAENRICLDCIGEMLCPFCGGTDNSAEHVTSCEREASTCEHGQWPHDCIDCQPHLVFGVTR